MFTALLRALVCRLMHGWDGIWDLRTRIRPDALPRAGMGPGGNYLSFLGWTLGMVSISSWILWLSFFFCFPQALVPYQQLQHVCVVPRRPTSLSPSTTCFDNTMSSISLFCLSLIPPSPPPSPSYYLILPRLPFSLPFSRSLSVSLSHIQLRHTTCACHYFSLLVYSRLFNRFCNTQSSSIRHQRLYRNYIKLSALPP